MKSKLSTASLVLLCLVVLIKPIEGFTIKPSHMATVNTAAHNLACSFKPSRSRRTVASKLNAVTPDLDIVALVAGQENYGFALVALCEAIWSFAQAPSFSHAKILAPASIAAIILVTISGPLVTSGDAGSVALGLEIATAVSALLGTSYVARLIAPNSPSPKEAAFAGLLVAIAGFFSFSQNLIVDGFVTLPSLPSLPLPQIPLGLGEQIDTDRY